MSKQLDGLFEDLEDETPTSLGKEIGDALSGVIKSIGQSQEQQTERTAQAIEAVAEKFSDAMRKQVPTVTARPVTEWDFDIQRDETGLMTRVVAKANP
jgi:hypothetical protein